jgi:hypothetical protein
MTAHDLSKRDPSTQEKMRWLVPNPNLPTGTPAAIAERFYEMGVVLLVWLQDGPQLIIALQRLIDAKDAAVRQAIADSKA